MRAPATPPDEMARLLDLHKLQILDSKPEERFDRLTRITQRVFGVDICLISLVDMGRQWFKSRQGLEASETSREISFCGHAILEDDVFVVGDTHNDERFADNPLVTESPHIRFYSGSPIRGRNGYRIGTLCVIDRKPREFSSDDRLLLADLSALVEAALNVESESVFDETTNVLNRRGFDVTARHLFNLCRRVQCDAAAIVVRVEELSDGDAENSQDNSDARLISFTEILNQSFPTADVVARIADNKFAVLICADSESSNTGLRQLRQFAATMKQDNNDDFSWSVGHSKYDSLRHLSLESFMNEADKDMQKHPPAT